MSTPDSDVRLARERVAAFMERLAIMAAGDKQTRFPISPSHDELDAIAFGINVLADELRWASARVAEADRWAADELRRSKEKAERDNERKSTFLRNASHEIRTPISVILTIADLLALPGLSNEERADLVVRLRANSRAVLSLIGNLLDLSRLEAGKLPVTTEAVSPIALVREVLHGLEPEARRKGLELRVDVEQNAHETIASDGHRLRQILVNVLANALKFTERGSVHVLVGSMRVADRDQLTIDVADTGIGIPADRHEHLFEPFEQVSSSITRTHGGTGLGLALSRRLAEELGGTLALVQSEPGRGTRFRLTLEAFPFEAGESASSPSRTQAEEWGRPTARRRPHPAGRRQRRPAAGYRTPPENGWRVGGLCSGRPAGGRDDDVERLRHRPDGHPDAQSQWARGHA